MNARTHTERILDAYLAPEADRLADRVIDAALADIARTPQRRALRVPWRFPSMPAMSRATGLAAVALVAVVAAGGLIYLNAKAPSDSVGQAPAPTTPGISGFTSYTSAVGGITIGYPDGWTLYRAATRKWRAGDESVSAHEAPFSDVFVNPSDRDGEEIAILVYQRPAGSGADITSREGLAAWSQANMCEDQDEVCETVPDVAEPMCAGKAACLPAILVSVPTGVFAVFGDAETGLVTVVHLGRADDFPATTRYGGGEQLLKSILTTMDVWTPQPGQIPSGG
jgi:hypothetical protein